VPSGKDESGKSENCALGRVTSTGGEAEDKSTGDGMFDSLDGIYCSLSIPKKDQGKKSGLNVLFLNI
jgi:hypothetical protein